MTAPALMDFAGDWRMSRLIEDRLAGETGRFAGRAVFTPDGDGLACHETGVLSLPGRAPMQAERRYLYVPHLSGGITVCFADGRPFHRIAPDSATPSDRHDCAPDLYRVRYDFTAWPAWTADWHVTGPRKDYDMRSTYRRARG